jgi:Zn-dependent protease
MLKILSKKEIIIITVIILILALTISLVKTWEFFLYTLLAVFLVLIINISAKKIMAFYLDSEIEIKLWEIKRYGFKANEYFKKPFPAGIFLPIITAAFSFGYLTWMASLIFDVKPKIYRAAKRHGLYSFSEMTEYHLGLIASAGILANLILAIIGYLINFPELAKINLFYAFFNMLPISDLDGNKIFFGSLVLWGFLASIVLIGLFCAIFII